MRLASAEPYRLLVPLVKPFVIATGTMTCYEGVLLRLRTSDGLEGWGEAAPSPVVTGETPASVERELLSARERMLDLDPLETEEAMSCAASFLKGSSAHAALDMALHDLKGLRYGIPVHRMLGGARRSIETSVTISIRDEEATVRQAEELLGRGFRVLKIKIGTDPGRDIARVRRLRGWLGSSVRLRADANQGYTVSQALRVLRALHGCDLEFCEQPTPMGDLRALAKVRRGSPVPIMADESVRGPSELLSIIRERAADMINLKLMKAGGISKALAMARIAEAAGMPCQMGCMIETRLAITAGAHVALACQNITTADLDGHWELASDPCTGGVRTSRGEHRLPERPGLGVEVLGPDRGRGRTRAPASPDARRRPPRGG